MALTPAPLISTIMMTSEPPIPSTMVYTIHIGICITNVLSMIFSIGWVCYICLQLKNIRKQAKRVDALDSVSLKEQRNKLNKYYLFLVVMLIEAMNLALRLVIYVVYIILDHSSCKLSCESIGEYKAYKFMESLQPYQLTWIGLSHSFALALVVSMTVTMLYLRETYSYYEKSFKCIKEWIVIGAVQFLSVWILLSIPYIALIGSALFVIYATVDFVALCNAAKRLFAILNMRLFDLQYERAEYHRFRRSMLHLRWLGVFLLSLFVYLVGNVLAQLAISLLLFQCYLNNYYNISHNVSNETEVELAKVASIVWLLNYVAIIQFDVVLVLLTIFYLIYTRLSRRNIREETRFLMEQYKGSISLHPRTYTL